MCWLPTVALSDLVLIVLLMLARCFAGCLRWLWATLCSLHRLRSLLALMRCGWCRCWCRCFSCPRPLRCWLCLQRLWATLCSQRKLFLECLLCCIVCDVGSCVLVLIVCLRFVCGDRLMCLPAGGSGRTLCPCCTGSPQERGFGGQSPPFISLFSLSVAPAMFWVVN